QEPAVRADPVGLLVSHVRARRAADRGETLAELPRAAVRLAGYGARRGVHDMTNRTGDGQTALVTGASYGIGVDLAECFARDGYDLVLSARSEAQLAEQAERIAKQYGVKVVPIAIDLGAH